MNRARLGAILATLLVVVGIPFSARATAATSPCTATRNGQNITHLFQQGNTWALTSVEQASCTKLQSQVVVTLYAFAGGKITYGKAISKAQQTCVQDTGCIVGITLGFGAKVPACVLLVGTAAAVDEATERQDLESQSHTQACF